MHATADAELRGDPVEALRHYEAIPMFSDSLHRQRLMQLSELGEEAPGWWWSRWLTVQARRPLWTGAVSVVPEPSLMRTLEIAYSHGVDTEAMEDLSPEVFLASLNERDWLLRQLVVYERGGLRELVEGLASPEMLDRADHVRQWPDAPMGGYRLDSEDGEHLQLTDLFDGRPVDVLDLGLAAQHGPGTHFLGRLVPTAQSPGTMFEWQPLPVDEDTARKVADRPADWLGSVAAQARAGALPCMFSYVGDGSMITDLPARAWISLLEPEEVHDLPVTAGLINYDDVALAVLEKLLRAAQRGATDFGAGRALVESLLLEPGLADEVCERLGGRQFGYAWFSLAGLVREPARSRCLRIHRRPGGTPRLS